MSSHFHPNDTLNGRLLAYERPEEKHLRGKLGYWRMVEERMIRAELAKEGITNPDYLTISKRVTANHANDLTYAETSKAFGDRCLAQQAAFMEADLREEAVDAAIEALRKIAAGHNDARALASEVLALLDSRS